MTKLYKAVRPDGRDFYTGRQEWAVGAVVKHPTSKKFGDMEPNRPATYLSASVEPAETLLSGHWPCLLHEVEPVGRTVKRTNFPYKRGACAWRVVAEVESWRALGPNGQEVVALIDRTRQLTRDEAQRLTAAMAAATNAARYAAADAARYAARSAARDAARNAARCAAKDAAEDAGKYAAWYAGKYVDGYAAKYAAGDAATALVVRDLITPEQFDALYGPWASVMEVAAA